MRAQLKELDAALSGVLQSSSELETDGSLTDSLTDTLKASQPSQAVGQFETSFSSVSTVSSQQAPPPTAKPIIALPRPPHHGGGRRRQKGGNASGLPLTCGAHSVLLAPCMEHWSYRRMSVDCP